MVIDIKKISVVVILVLALIIGVVYISSNPQINYYCEIDSDCIIVDKHNCCGYYPVCANKDSKPNPDFVKAQCKFSVGSNICGFPDITSCSCVENKCIPN